MHLPWEVVRRFPEVAHRLWVPEDDGRCFFVRLVGYMKVNPPSNVPDSRLEIETMKKEKY